jgi:phage baseplate assembly protein W
MNGMDARTGAPLDGVEHLRQSIADILSTPIGSRIARRDYGSLLPDLIDQAMNPAGRMRLLAATALALLRWEPRIALSNVAIQQVGPACFALILDVRRTDVPAVAARTRLSIPLAGALPAYA